MVKKEIQFITNEIDENDLIEKIKEMKLVSKYINNKKIKKQFILKIN